jgi:hypothetical protein
MDSRRRLEGNQVSLLSSIPVGYRKFLFTLTVTTGAAIMAWVGFPLLFWYFAVRCKVPAEETVKLIQELRQVILWGGGASVGIFSGANLAEWYLRRPKEAKDGHGTD